MAGRKGYERRGRPAKVKDFYDSAVPEADKVALKLARQVKGIDQEIAVLRVRLRRALEEHPENMGLMLKGVELLVRALGANHKLPEGRQGRSYGKREGVARGIQDDHSTGGTR